MHCHYEAVTWALPKEPTWFQLQALEQTQSPWPPFPFFTTEQVPPNGATSGSGSKPWNRHYSLSMSDGQSIGVPRITDEDLVASAPAVRALLVNRLEQLWRPVEAALQRDRESEGMLPVDPRLLEIGLRVVKDEAALYRLSRPPVLGDDASDQDALGPGVDRRALVEAQLVEREERLRSHLQ